MVMIVMSRHAFILPESTDAAYLVAHDPKSGATMSGTKGRVCESAGALLNVKLRLKMSPGEQLPCESTDRAKN
jgi:hypothetical protein